MTTPEHPEPRLERKAGPADGVVVLELGGELDLAISGRLRELVDQLTAEQPSLLVADVAEVGFMDSTILRELLRAHREVNRQGGRMVVAGAQPTVRRLLELTGTAELFVLADSREQALGA